MGGIVFVVVLILATPFILSIIALVQASGAKAELRRLTERLLILESRLEDLLARPTSAPRPSETSEPAAAGLGVPVDETKAPPAPAAAPSWSEFVESASAEPALATAPVSEPIFAPSETAPLAESAPPGQAAVPPPPPVTPPPATAPAGWSWENISWEKFMGVKLFAWVGGLALFLAVAFFVKYSFDNNLISPPVRVGIGFLIGLGLILGGLKLSLAQNAVTVQTLCATGIVILYADFFAAHSLYQLIPSSIATFGLMVLVTATAFLLAVRLNAQVVAILGLLGGFLTPILLSTGKDNPLGLFGYIAILDFGLAAVALRQRWNHLVTLAAGATVLMQIAWVDRFFAQEKILTALAIFLFFPWFFGGILYAAHRLRRAEKWEEASALLHAAVAFGFVLYLLGRPYREIALRPGLVFGFVFLVDLIPLGVAWLRPHLRPTQLVAGGVVFFLLTTWTVQFLSDDLLNWALGLYFFFALLHTVYPVLNRQVAALSTRHAWVHLFPLAALVLMMIPVLKLGGELSWLIWPAVLLVSVLAIGLAVLLGTIVPILAAVVLTMLNLALWIGRVPVDQFQLPSVLIVLGLFSVVFFGAGLWASRQIIQRLRAQGQADQLTEQGLKINLKDPEAELMVQVPLFAALLPFVLLMLVLQRLPLPNPSPVFGLAVLLIVLLLGLVRFLAADFLTAVAAAGALALEYLWFYHNPSPDNPWLPLLWFVGFYGLFMVFPFLFTRPFLNRLIPWTVAALSGPAHFYLIHRFIMRAYPNPYPGLIPALLALPALAGLVWLIRQVPEDHPQRNALLALFGGSALFFITAIFPLQFSRQWITLGWALEGAALIWLFQRVPHPGLRLVGVALLVAAFVRLACNPAVLDYQQRSGRPILNWFLYTYGVTALCQFAGARLLAPPRNFIRQFNVPPVLYGLGTLLAFLLLNIEIADYFSTGSFVTFQFSGNLARDMTYSLGWTLFAFGLFIIGIVKQARPARFAGLGLLTITLVKIFLHDLWRLGGLYRVGSLVGLAVVLILVSFIYQRFLARESAAPKTPPAAE